MDKYKTVDDCPIAVKSLTPEAQAKWMEIANACIKGGDGEMFACSRAWEAIRDNWTKKEDGSWEKTIPASNYATYDLSDPTHEMKGVEIFAAGEWNGDKYSAADLDEMVKNFNAGAVKTVPFKVGHDKNQKVAGQPNIGILDRIYRKGEKLFADISNIPKLVADLINKKAYTAVSAEIAWGAQFGQNVYARLLTGVALLGAEIPAVNSLATLPAVYNFADIRAYELPLDKKTMGVDNGHKTGGDTMNLEQALSKISELEAKVAEMSASLTTEKTRAEKAEGDLQTIKADADNAQVENFVAKLIDDKKAVPAMKDQIKQSLLAADNSEKKEYSVGDKKVSETARETLMKVYSSMGKLAIFGQSGETGDLNKSAGDKAVDLAKAYASEHKVDFRSALDKVYEMHPELKSKAPVMGAPTQK